MGMRRLKDKLSFNDRDFDDIYPASARKLSLIHWTPIEVVRKTTSLLVDHAGARILDVGSGVGKFCIVGALTSSGYFTGVEQRESFVRIASELIDQYEIPRVRFIHDNFKNLDWRAFDGIYLFNPFQENKTPEQCLDHSVQLSRELYIDYVTHTEDKLARMPQGTRVVTYHGFGGVFPTSYRREVSEWCYRGPLELWIKRA